MTNTAITSKKIIQIPADIKKMLGPPPLLSFEDPVIYEKFFLKFADGMRPTDFPEWLYLNSVVYYSWEILRYRRIKVLLVAIREQEVREVHIERFQIAKKKCPKEIALSERQVAQLFMQELGNFERIEALLASAESRLASTFREIDKRRDSLASRLKKSSDDIINGDFSELHPAPEQIKQIEKDQWAPERVDADANPTSPTEGGG